MNRRVAIVTRALAPYHKALQESFAEAAGADGGTVCLFYPEETASVFDLASTLPSAKNLTHEHVPSMRIPPAIMMLGQPWKTERMESRLPSTALWHALSRFDPGVVWMHEYSPYSLASMAWAKWHRRPIVVSTDVGFSNRNAFVPHAQYWHGFWSRWVDGVIANTRGAMQPITSVPKRVIAAFHAADSRKLKPSLQKTRKEEITFVQVGRVVPRKGADLLLAALAKLKDDGFTNWRLRLLGEDSNGWGKMQILKHGLEGRVEITGHLSGAALWGAFAQADVFVLATRQDSYAAVVHEAACLGLPMVVSRHAGAADALLEDGVNGFIIEPEDTASFAKCLGAFVDPVLLERMSVAARQTGEQFSAHARAEAIWSWMQEHFIR